MTVGVYDNDHAVARVIQLVVMSFDVTEIIDGERLLCEHSNNILTYKNNPT